MVGRALSRAVRWAEAARAFEQLTGLSPENPAPLLALAQCREALHDQPGALAAYERAVAIAPDSPSVLFALGGSCLRAGKLDEAIACLEAAAATDPGRPEYRVNLALAHLKHGDLLGARRVFGELARRWPDLREVGELRSLLRRVSEPGA